MTLVNYKNQKAKILNTLEDDKLEIYLLDDQLIIECNKKDLKFNDKKIKLPSSRKDLYEIINNHKNDKNDIILMIKKLIESSKLELLEITEEQFIEQLVNIPDRSDIVSYIRTIRDNGQININLINNSFLPKNKK